MHPDPSKPKSVGTLVLGLAAAFVVVIATTWSLASWDIDQRLAAAPDAPRASTRSADARGRDEAQDPSDSRLRRAEIPIPVVRESVPPEPATIQADGTVPVPPPAKSLMELGRDRENARREIQQWAERLELGLDLPAALPQEAWDKLIQAHERFKAKAAAISAERSPLVHQLGENRIARVDFVEFRNPDDRTGAKPTAEDRERDARLAEAKRTTLDEGLMIQGAGPFTRIVKIRPGESPAFDRLTRDFKSAGFELVTSARDVVTRLR